MTIATDIKHAAEGEVEDKRRLKVVKPSSSGRHWLARWSVIALTFAAIGMQIASLSQPWWWIKLYAPQYPKGLQIIISLTGVSGDAKEVDILNHYIGMASLTKAAVFERQMAAYGIAALAVMVLVVAVLAGRRYGKVLPVVGFVFPAAFLADSFYWMHRFGHNLNPEAPIKLPSFTPQLFGNGQIGQFKTFAQPSAGFWLAVGAFVVLIVAAVIRSRVCAHCAKAGTCRTVCRDAFIGPKAGARP